MRVGLASGKGELHSCESVGIQVRENIAWTLQRAVKQYERTAVRLGIMQVYER